MDEFTPVPEAALQEIIRTNARNMYRGEYVRMAQELLALRGKVTGNRIENVVILNPEQYDDIGLKVYEHTRPSGARLYICHLAGLPLVFQGAAQNYSVYTADLVLVDGEEF
jgi:hypothetical protein